MIGMPIVPKAEHIFVRSYWMILSVLILGFLGLELIVLQAIDANAAEPFKIRLPETASVDEVKNEFGTNTEEFYENLPRGLWLDVAEKRILVVAVIVDKDASRDDLEFQLLSDLDDLILSHIGEIPQYELDKIPFKSQALRELSAKLAYQHAVGSARNYNSMGRIPFRQTQDGLGKLVFETSTELFDVIEGKVNGPDWNSVRGEIFGSLFHDRNFRTLSEILETEARIFDVLIVKEQMDSSLRAENGFNLNNQMDPIEYAKKIIFSYESDLAFAGPPTSIIRPMLRGHRFYDSLIRVVSRLPATTALSAKTALDVVRKPLENLQGGREFFNIIELSNRGTLPPELLSKIEKFGAYAAKYVSQTAGIVFLTEKMFDQNL